MCTILQHKQNKSIQLDFIFLVVLAESSKHLLFLSIQTAHQIHAGIAFHQSSFLFLGPFLCQHLSTSFVDPSMSVAIQSFLGFHNCIIISECLSHKKHLLHMSEPYFWRFSRVRQAFYKQTISKLLEWSFGSPDPFP